MSCTPSTEQPTTINPEAFFPMIFSTRGKIGPWGMEADCSLNKILNASRPSEHPPVRGKNMSKRLLGGIIGYRYKTSS